MNVLVLSPYPQRIGGTLREAGDRVIATDEPIDVGLLRDLRVRWVISYGYRHVLGRDIVEALDGRVVDLHLSARPRVRVIDGGDGLAVSDGQPDAEIEALFAKVWRDIRTGTAHGFDQTDGDFHHRRPGRRIFKKRPPDGADTRLATAQRLRRDRRWTAVGIPAPTPAATEATAPR